MCFSATASFSSAAFLVAASGVALHQKPTRRELPYALMPALFGIQQFLEGLVWLSLRDPTALASCLSPGVLAQAFSLFSQVFWPVFVPLAVGLMEQVAWRRKAIAGCAIAGLITSMFLLSAMLQAPITAELQGQHIAYAFSHTHLVTASALYLVGACLSPLLSSHPSVRLFGVIAVATALLTSLIFSIWFTSVWCFFAGLMSSVVLLHFFPRAQLFLRPHLRA
jgi:hypothetical protein